MLEDADLPLNMHSHEPWDATRPYLPPMEKDEKKNLG